MVDILMGTGWIKRWGRGRPRLKPDRVAEGLQQPIHPPEAAPPRDRCRHPDPQHREASAGFRSSGLSAAQPDRTTDQPPQAIPSHCHPLRKARRELSRYDYDWSHPPMALTFADTA